MKRAVKNDGFTIVELLIVIVVIAILAAITIVAFNDIQERSRLSAASAELKQVATQLSTYQVLNGDTLPASLEGISGASYWLDTGK